MDYVDCLTPIVGLSETECPCYDIPEEGNTSVIDRFLDDEMYSVPLSFTNTKIDCDSGGIWDVLQKSRRKGIGLFVGLISRAIEEGRESVNSIYNGSAGQEKYTGSLPAKSYYELVIDSRRYRSTQMRIDYIDFYMTSAGSMDAEFVNLNTGDVVHSESLTLPSSIFHYVPNTPVTLPMSDEFGRKIQWSIRISGLTPMNNKIYCNCPGKDLHKKYFVLYSRSGDTVPELESSSKLIYSSGMKIGFDFSCNYDWICGDYDYQTGFGRTFAETIFLCCVVELLTFILNRSTPLTPAPPEYIMDKKNTAMDIIQNNIKWIIDNVPRNASDCIGCKKPGIRKGEILI